MEVDMERVNLLDHDSVAENYEGGDQTEEGDIPCNQDAPKFTTKATLQVNVDDAVNFKELESLERKHHEVEQISAKVLQTKYSVFIQDYGPINEAAKKVDENGNALHQNTMSKAKKKKIQAEKNVMTSYSAEKLKGHRSDIINDVEKLLEFIGDKQAGAQNRNNRQKQPHKNSSEETSKGGKKQKGGGGAQASAKNNKENNTRNDLKKSNSLDEISTTKLDGFKFEVEKKEDKEEERRTKAEEEKKPKTEDERKPKEDEDKRPKQEEERKPKEEEDKKTVQKGKKEAVNEKAKKMEAAVVEKPKDNVIVLDSTPKAKTKEIVEHAAAATTSSNHPPSKPVFPTFDYGPDTSSDFHVVTKKKKTKKRRNSLSGGRNHKTSTNAAASASSSSAASNLLSKLDAASDTRRTSSPAAVVPRGKSVCSVPQSDKSNDGGDADSVHSLPAPQRTRDACVAAVAEDAPISCADIARNAAERRTQTQPHQPQPQLHQPPQPQPHQPSQPQAHQPQPPQQQPHQPQPQEPQKRDAKVGRDTLSEEGSPKGTVQWLSPEPQAAAGMANAQTQTTPPKEAPPPDVHNIKSFPAIGNAAAAVKTKVDRSVSIAGSARGQQGGGKSPPQQQQQQQRVTQCVNVELKKPQTMVASVQTSPNNVPEQQRDIKTDLSIIQANEMETVQYNNQMMPRMEIPDCQTIEKLNYMSQPGAHMPLHLQHHVVPPQHLHMVPPPPRPPSQPPHHIPMMMPPPPPPHPHDHLYTAAHHHAATAHQHHQQQMYNPVMPHPHHHHHPHHQPPHPHHHPGPPQYHPHAHPLAYSAQAYEGMAVAYVDPAYMPQGGVVGQHHNPMQQDAIAQPPREKASRWTVADQQQEKTPKSNKKRYDKSHNPVDRRKDNGAAPSRSPSQTTPHPNQAVIPSTQRGHAHQQPSRRSRGAEYGHAHGHSRGREDFGRSNCDNRDAAASTNANDCGGASSGEETSVGAVDRPPVVILSGASGRDVPGIEFGFAVNPDLVDANGEDEEEVDEEEEEGAVGGYDPCETFDRFYRQPEANIDVVSYEKMLNYVGTAWEDVINSGTAQYYTSTPNNNQDNASPE